MGRAQRQPAATVSPGQQFDTVLGRGRGLPPHLQACSWPEVRLVQTATALRQLHKSVIDDPPVTPDEISAYWAGLLNLQRRLPVAVQQTGAWREVLTQATQLDMRGRRMVLHAQEFWQRTDMARDELTKDAFAHQRVTADMVVAASVRAHPGADLNDLLRVVAAADGPAPTLTFTEFGELCFQRPGQLETLAPLLGPSAPHANEKMTAFQAGFGGGNMVALARYGLADWPVLPKNSLLTVPRQAMLDACADGKENAQCGAWETLWKHLVRKDKDEAALDENFWRPLVQTIDIHSEQASVLAANFLERRSSKFIETIVDPMRQEIASALTRSILTAMSETVAGRKPWRLTADQQRQFQTVLGSWGAETDCPPSQELRVLRRAVRAASVPA